MHILECAQSQMDQSSLDLECRFKTRDAMRERLKSDRKNLELRLFAGVRTSANRSRPTPCSRQRNGKRLGSSLLDSATDLESCVSPPKTRRNIHYKEVKGLPTIKPLCERCKVATTELMLWQASLEYGLPRLRVGSTTSHNATALSQRKRGNEA